MYYPDELIEEIRRKKAAPILGCALSTMRNRLPFP